MTSNEPTAGRQGFRYRRRRRGVKGAVVDLDTGQIIGERFVSTPCNRPPRGGHHYRRRGGPALRLDRAVWGDLPGVVVDGGSRPPQTSTVPDRHPCRRVDEHGSTDSRSRSSTTPMPPVWLNSGTAPPQPRRCGGAAHLRHRHRLSGDPQRNVAAQHRVRAHRGRGQGGRAPCRRPVREHPRWGYRKWTKQVTKVLVAIENAIWPDLFIAGGGSAGKPTIDPLLKNRTPVVPAELLNTAGIVGAAMAAAENHREQ